MALLGLKSNPLWNFEVYKKSYNGTKISWKLNCVSHYLAPQLKRHKGNIDEMKKIPCHHGKDLTSRVFRHSMHLTPETFRFNCQLHIILGTKYARLYV